MGTMIQSYRLGEDEFRGAQFAAHPRDLKGCNDLLSITRPALIEEIHRLYLEAGADIIETNTFNATAVSLADYGLEGQAYAINRAAAEVAVRAAREMTRRTPGRPRFVAGSMGPTNRTASLSPDVNRPGFRAIDFDALAAAYYEQARGLVDGGVDILVPETGFDTLNLKAALFAISRCFDETGRRLPVIASITITDASGRTLSGQTVRAAWISLSHADLLAAGINCALGARRDAPARRGAVRHRPHVPRLLAERGPSQRDGRLRPDARRDGRDPRRVRARGVAQHRGRVLRHDAGLRPRHRRRRRGRRAEAPARPLPPHGVQRPRAPDPPARLELHHDRRADERHRLARVRAPGPGRRLRGGARRGAPAGRGGRQHPRREPGRGPARFGPRDDRVPEPRRLRAGDRAPPDHGRLLAVRGPRGGAEAAAGEGHRQLDQPQGGGGDLPRAGPPGPALRRGGGRDGVRRAGAGDDRRPQGRGPLARRPDPGGRGRLPAAGHRPRPRDPHRRDRHRGAQRLRGRFPRGREAPQGALPRGQDQRRREQHLVLLPGERRGARSDARGLPLPRHRGRHGHGDRQRRAARGLRGDPDGPARAGRGRPPEPPPRRDGAARRLRRDGEGTGPRAGEGRRVAPRRRRGAPGACPGAGDRRPRRGGRGGGAARSSDAPSP